MEELKFQAEKTKDSLKRLEEALKEDVSKNELALDASIQRFEFVFENLWKFGKMILKENFNKDCYSPRSCFKALFALSIIKDEEIWLKFLKYRNLTVHTYDYGISSEVYEFISKNFKFLKDLFKQLQKEIE